MILTLIGIGIFVAYFGCLSSLLNVAFKPRRRLRFFLGNLCQRRLGQIYSYGILFFPLISLFLQFPRFEQSFLLNLQTIANTAYWPRELRPETTRNRLPCEIFRPTGRNFPQFHCSGIEKSPSFAEARSLQFSIVGVNEFVGYA